MKAGPFDFDRVVGLSADCCRVLTYKGGLGCRLHVRIINLWTRTVIFRTTLLDKDRQPIRPHVSLLFDSDTSEEQPVIAKVSIARSGRAGEDYQVTDSQSSIWTTGRQFCAVAKKVLHKLNLQRIFPCQLQPKAERRRLLN